MNMARSAQTQNRPDALRALLATPETLETLFDALEDVVFFVKDAAGCYQFVNDTLVRRVGAAHKAELLGRRADEVFQGQLGRAFRRQDETVVQSGRELRDRLELHLYPSHEKGWCRTIKLPLWECGELVGLVGFSQDLHMPAEERAPASVAEAIAHINTHLEDRLTVPQLAAITHMAPRTFERAVQRLFGISAGELVIKARIDRACSLLTQSTESIAQIALACGYFDHSAFARQFRARVGMTPRAFRSSMSQST